MPTIPSPGYPASGSNRTRATVRAELADYIGGRNKPDIQLKADRSWDAAVRYFNRYAWKFNRQTYGIVMDSNMRANQTAPTLSRDTGSGTGFTLTSGNVITYWIEERVKDGPRIIRRNDELGTKVVTLTGDGTNDKPVITRPALANPDTTHWALYGTAPGDPWPNGAELAEVPAATTTIEDLRVGYDPRPTGAIYLNNFWDLPSQVRNPVRCHMLDPQGRERRSLIFIPYEQYSVMLTRLVGSATTPTFYTIRNLYRTGQLITHPRNGQQAVWPTLRFVYDSYIMPAGSELDSVLDVPMEMDEAIFQKAVAFIMERHTKDAQRIAQQHAAADELRMALEMEWRGFEDR